MVASTYRRIAIVLLLALCGCAKTDKILVPERSCALYWHNMKYDRESFNCLNKAVRYFNCLKCPAKVVIGKIGSNPVGHAWVEVKENNKWYLIDVSDSPGSWGWERKYYPQYHAEKIHLESVPVSE